jgi:4-carboxymuconolactone decarboxylase
MRSTANDRGEQWISRSCDRSGAAVSETGMETHMKRLAALIALIPLLVTASAQARQAGTPSGRTDMPMNEAIRAVAPALENYAQGRLFGDVWKRADLSPRDRSIVTLAAMIARNQTTEMPFYLKLALDNGVKPGEISELITHLAFYSGWGNAMSAVSMAREVFARRGIKPEQLPQASDKPLALDEKAEAQRAERVEQDFGAVAPGVVLYTGELLFKDLWLRPGLAARDRSLVTVSALVASGQVAQITYHLNRAMDNGLTKKQAGEVLTHLAFYAGWPNVFSALPVVKAVFEKRPG